jgi:hypothetical protein
MEKIRRQRILWYTFSLIITKLMMLRPMLMEQITWHLSAKFYNSRWIAISPSPEVHFLHVT